MPPKLPSSLYDPHMMSGQLGDSIDCIWPPFRLRMFPTIRVAQCFAVYQPQLTPALFSALEVRSKGLAVRLEKRVGQQTTGVCSASTEHFLKIAKFDGIKIQILIISCDEKRFHQKFWFKTTLSCHTLQHKKCSRAKKRMTIDDGWRCYWQAGNWLSQFGIANSELWPVCCQTISMSYTEPSLRPP